MNIEIPDDIDPAVRKILLVVLPIKYALELLGNKTQAATFLHMSPKTLLSIIRKYPKHFDWKLNATAHVHSGFLQKVQELDPVMQSEFWTYFEDNYKIKPGYRFAGPPEKNRIRKLALTAFLAKNSKSG